MRKLIPYLLAALVPYAIAELVPFLSTRINSRLGAVVLIILLALTFTCLYLNRKKIRWIRKHTSSLGKYEGRWIEILTDKPDYPYAICMITYDAKKEKYKFSGNNYAKDFSGRKRSFSCNDFYLNQNGFGYVDQLDEGTTKGYGTYSFDDDVSSNNPTKANGYFIDFTGECCECTSCRVVMYKLDKKFQKTKGIDPKLPDLDLIKIYHKHYGHPHFPKSSEVSSIC
ncbi:MAG: hypothetical protein FWB76_05225 [Oscillospiraceae bacterium]|nr:hypothetical protein [Oscillospiraceae bacterium]